MKAKKTIKFINNERTSRKVISSKGCDNSSNDWCKTLDYGECHVFSTDYCESKDYASCHHSAGDYCSQFGSDYHGCYFGQYDYS